MTLIISAEADLAEVVRLHKLFSVVNPKLFFSDPDSCPTFQEISDPDPDSDSDPDPISDPT